MRSRTTGETWRDKIKNSPDYWPNEEVLADVDRRLGLEPKPWVNNPEYGHVKQAVMPETQDYDGDRLQGMSYDITIIDEISEWWENSLSTLDPEWLCAMEKIHRHINELDICTNAIGAVSYTNHCNEEKGTTTMANVIKKEDMQFIEGYLTVDGTVVSPGFVRDYNSLEHLLQRAAFENEQNKIQSARFEPQSAFADRLIAVPSPKTPTLDKEAAKADKMSNENKLIRNKEQAEMILDGFNSVVEFVCGNTVVVYDTDYHSTLIDAPVLGNPLELTKEKLLKLVCEAVEYPLG